VRARERAKKSAKKNVASDAMRFGVLMLPLDPWPATVARARVIEALGYDHLWTYDHLTWRRYRDHAWHAALPWLTGMATATSTIGLGTMVASPNFRHPVTLAKEAITIDHIAGGRLTLGIGAGGVGFDATVFGAEPLSTKQLLDRFGEFTELLDRLFREHTVSYEGTYFTAHEAQTLPAPPDQPRPRVAIAGGGKRALGLVAQYADAWITYGDTSRRDLTEAGTEIIVAAQVQRFEDACAAIGRDPLDVPRIYLIGNTEARPLASVQAFDDFAGRYDELGFTDLVFHHPRPDDPIWNEPEAIVEQIATEVIPRRR
jgi:alkanesulfonate monooxygenase SsuD/methylene tetrahydromethanopterin reductase-like flavin-dependent oxidoreductase (luciferase family)